MIAGRLAKIILSKISAGVKGSKEKI